MGSKTPVKLKALKSMFRSILFRLVTTQFLLIDFISFLLKRDSVSLFQSEGILYFLNSSLDFTQKSVRITLGEFSCACHTGMKSFLIMFVQVTGSNFDYVGNREKSKYGEIIVAKNRL